MQFNTQFNLGQEVYYIGTDFRARAGIVSGVQIQTQNPTPAPGEGATHFVTVVQYLIDSRYMTESRVFANRKDLIAYVLSIPDDIEISLDLTKGD